MSLPGPISAHAMGTPLNRVDGRSKVTGSAKYPAEFALESMVHAFLVMSSISNGRITRIDSAMVKRAPGALRVITHLNAPKLANPASGRSKGIRIELRNPLADDKISYGGQYVTLVVADTLENARYAASLVEISYCRRRLAMTMSCCGMARHVRSALRLVRAPSG